MTYHITGKIIPKTLCMIAAACLIAFPAAGCSSSPEQKTASSSSSSTDPSGTTNSSSKPDESSSSTDHSNSSDSAGPTTTPPSSSNSPLPNTSDSSKSNAAATLSVSEASSHIVSLNNQAKDCYEGAYAAALQGDVVKNQYYEDKIDDIIEEFENLKVPDELTDAYAENHAALLNSKFAISYMTGVSTGISTNDGDLTDYYANLASDAMEDAAKNFDNVTSILNRK